MSALFLYHLTRHESILIYIIVYIILVGFPHIIRNGGLRVCMYIYIYVCVCVLNALACKLSMPVASCCHPIEAYPQNQSLVEKVCFS